MISLGRWQVSSHRLGMQDYGVSLDGKGKGREMPVYWERANQITSDGWG